jgi:hypothetical protein
MRQSIKTVGLKLWDEESKQMVGYKHLRKVQAQG